MSDPKLRVEEATACTCECGCLYPLLSTPSRMMLKCFSCRKQIHYGGTPLTKEDPPR